MKKTVLALAACAALALPSAAFAGDNYNPNPNASACGQEHGAFGAFGKENNFAGGANGQVTASLNSANGSAVHDPSFVGCV
jgi:hypothetical protein